MGYLHNNIIKKSLRSDSEVEFTLLFTNYTYLGKRKLRLSIYSLKSALPCQIIRQRQEKSLR